MSGGNAVGSQEDTIEPESRRTGRWSLCDVRECLSSWAAASRAVCRWSNSHAPPEPGDIVEVIVQQLNPEDGLYDLRLPSAAAEVADWGDLSEGMIGRGASHRP